MNEKDLIKMIKNFNPALLKNVCGKAHDVYIGEWVRWWLDKKKNRIVINPARKIKRRGRNSDIMFCERKGKSYVVLGIAEIETTHETTHSSLKQKIHTLKEYININRYPNIMFLLVCTRACYDSKRRSFSDNKHRLHDAIKEMKKYSKKSPQIVWIFSIFKNMDERDLKIEGVDIRPDEYVWFKVPIEGCGHVIIKKGRRIKCTFDGFNLDEE